MSLKNFFNKQNTFNSKDIALFIEDDSENEDNLYHLNSIFNYLKDDKYNVNLRISTIKLKKAKKKELVNKYKQKFAEDSACMNESNILLEGQISGEDFVTFRNTGLSNSRIGIIIACDNSCISISTKRKSKNNKYGSLIYKEFRRNNGFDDYFEIDLENEKYYRSIRRGDVMYTESTSYPFEEELQLIEENAQPSDEPRVNDEYKKITGLNFISVDEKTNISNVLKISPFLVNVETCKFDKNNKIIAKEHFYKIFKSKKEWMVGYRPEMVFIESLKDNSSEKMMFRLIEAEGVYADNNSFKQSFDGKFSIKKVDLQTIEDKVIYIPFFIGNDIKKMYRNGYDIPEHLKNIYDYSVAQIHIRENNKDLVSKD